MKNDFSWDRFEDLPVVGILRGFAPEAVEQIVAASQRGGLRNIEITMNTPGAAGQIKQVRELAGDAMNVGAGTVCTLDDLDVAAAAGASFIVTPVLVPDVVREAKRRELVVIPGAFTPTEIHQAANLGADLVKVFPVDQLGPNYIKNILAPLPHLRLVPTGGVSVETLPAFRAAGAAGFGVGSPLFAKPRVDAGDWVWIEEQARRFVEAWQSSKDSSV